MMGKGGQGRASAKGWADQNRPGPYSGSGKGFPSHCARCGSTKECMRAAVRQLMGTTASLMSQHNLLARQLMNISTVLDRDLHPDREGLSQAVPTGADNPQMQFCGDETWHGMPSSDKNTPENKLLFAASGGCPLCVELLLQARVSPECKSAEGYTPLQFAETTAANGGKTAQVVAILAQAIEEEEEARALARIGGNEEHEESEEEAHASDEVLVLR